MRISSIINVQHLATSRNCVAERAQHTCAQQSCDMLCWIIMIVWPGLANAGPTMFRYLVLTCCDRLASALFIPVSFQVIWWHRRTRFWRPIWYELITKRHLLQLDSNTFDIIQLTLSWYFIAKFFILTSSACAYFKQSLGEVFVIFRINKVE